MFLIYVCVCIAWKVGESQTDFFFFKKSTMYNFKNEIGLTE